MSLSVALRTDVVDEGDAREIMEAIESFLVRRAVVGIEPTGLHAVFKRLWMDCDGKYDFETVCAAIRKHPTVSWPDEVTFRAAVLDRSIYGSGIATYLIREFDRSLGGDEPSDIPWIEHVLPQSSSEDWLTIFSKEEQLKVADTFANLIPLSSKMNQSLANKAYAHKRKRYEEDAMFKSARAFARVYSDWTPKTLAARAKKQADWACKRWPI